MTLEAFLPVLVPQTPMLIPSRFANTWHQPVSLATDEVRSGRPAFDLVPVHWGKDRLGWTWAIERQREGEAQAEEVFGSSNFKWKWLKKMLWLVVCVCVRFFIAVNYA